MKPFLKLDELTTKRIRGLIEKCDELNLGNVNFQYYETAKSGEVHFYMDKYTKHWELNVNQRRERERDIYKIIEGTLIFDYSESN